MAVTAADVLMQTSDVTSVESIDRRMGSLGGAGLGPGRPGPRRAGARPDGVLRQLRRRGRRRRDADRRRGVRRPRRRRPHRDAVRGRPRSAPTTGAVSAELRELDLADPATRGLFDLTSGRWPTEAGEVVVNQALVDKGYGVGETLDSPGAGKVDPVIVGIAENDRRCATTRSPPGRSGPSASTPTSLAHWLVDGAPVTWATGARAQRARRVRRVALGDPGPAARRSSGRPTPGRARATPTPPSR